MPSPLADLRAFLWDQRLVIAVTAIILAAITAAMLLFGEPLGSSPWSYSFF